MGFGWGDTIHPEDRYRRIVESTDDFAIVTMDHAGVITDWNIGVERITGYAATEALGESAELLFTPEDRCRRFHRGDARCPRSGRAVNERWHVRKDGRRFWASGLLTVLETPRLGLLSIFRDRTAEYE